MMRCKAPFYMGGGIGTELNKFDLQRFANVSNPYEAIINSNIITNGLIQQPLVDLSYYARDNITDYQTITEIPQENIEYLSSGLVASSCEYMFYNCNALTSISWNEFNIDTSKCSTTVNMFDNCISLTSLNLSNFDTSKVTNMYEMFYYCFALTSLDLSNFDTSKVTDMNDMFNECISLQEIICPNGFDMSSCTDVTYMFGGCSSYSGEPLHFKNVSRDLDFNITSGIEGTHYVIDSYKD